MATAFLVYEESSEIARSKIDLKKRFFFPPQPVFYLAAFNKAQPTNSGLSETWITSDELYEAI